MSKPHQRSPVALVTGAGRRLGKHIAYSLAENGYDLVIHYNTSRKGAREAVEHIRKLGRDAISLRADITKRGQVKRMVDSAIKRFKRIDLLINNAGVFLDSPLEKTTEVLWDKTLDLNLKAVFFCSQIVSRSMLENRRGRIINIASLGGLQAWPRHLPYSVSKAGVIMLTRCLAKALAPVIPVNAIAPGIIAMPGEDNDIMRQWIKKSRIPLGKYGRVSDIANLVVYLATASEYITGQTFAVDGGRSA